jgi:hypothetical protein
MKCPAQLKLSFNPNQTNQIEVKEVLEWLNAATKRRKKHSVIRHTPESFVNVLTSVGLAIGGGTGMAVEVRKRKLGIT